MAELWSCTWRCPSPILPYRSRRSYNFLCCSNIPNGNGKEETHAPFLLRSAVSGVTELLRLFFPVAPVVVNNEKQDKISFFNVDLVLNIIKSDYEKAYFVTGLFTSDIYAENCIFEDPTIKIRGKELYARDLSLLINFFDNPSIQLKKINKDIVSDEEFIIASWKLRTYLKLPWRPLILVDGRTMYYLDEQLRIIRHVEKWDISAVEAILQIFTSNDN